MNPVKVIRHHIYLLQLENYNIGRYIGGMLRGLLLPRRKPQKKIIRTPKLILVSAGAIFFQFTASAYVAALISSQPALSIRFAASIAALFIALSYVHFVFLTASTIAIYPLDAAVKKYLTMRARGGVSSLPNIKVIGITGSFGKTTTKDVLVAILGKKFRVLSTKENQNTPIGISRLILKELDKNVDVFVVEMGAYKKGDIKRLCRIAPPDISILTGINESHLERFGSIKNTISAKFEVVRHAKKNATAILNADSKPVSEFANVNVGDKKTLWFTAGTNKRAKYEVGDFAFNEAVPSVSFSLTTGGEKVFSFDLPFIAEYIAGTLNAAVLTAEELGMEREEIQIAASGLMPTPHRLEVVSKKDGVLVIDDGYNGNPDGAREAIMALSRFKSRRRIYVTPGLVEMGERSREVHEEIGKYLAGVANLVVLIRTKGGKYISDGLVAGGFPKDGIIWYETSQEAYKSLPHILKSGDVVLFQNDLPENYM